MNEFHSSSSSSSSSRFAPFVTAAVRGVAEALCSWFVLAGLTCSLDTGRP